MEFNFLGKQYDYLAVTEMSHFWLADKCGKERLGKIYVYALGFYGNETVSIFIPMYIRCYSDFSEFGLKIGGDCSQLIHISNGSINQYIAYSRAREDEILEMLRGQYHFSEIITKIINKIYKKH